MEFALKIGSFLILLVLTYQDFKERRVSLYLLILSWIFVSLLYYSATGIQDYLINIGFNLILILLILGVLFTYTRLKLKQRFLEVFGIGDALFFLILACGFPVQTFVVLFVGSLFFALLLFTVLKPNLHHKTVPLAGLQAAFLAGILSTNWLFNLVNLYVP